MTPKHILIIENPGTGYAAKILGSLNGLPGPFCLHTVHSLDILCNRMRFMETGYRAVFMNSELWDHRVCRFLGRHSDQPALVLFTGRGEEGGTGCGLGQPYILSTSGDLTAVCSEIFEAIGHQPIRWDFILGRAGQQWHKIDLNRIEKVERHAGLTSIQTCCALYDCQFTAPAPEAWMPEWELENQIAKSSAVKGPRKSKYSVH